MLSGCWEQWWRSSCRKRSATTTFASEWISPQCCASEADALVQVVEHADDDVHAEVLSHCNVDGEHTVDQPFLGWDVHFLVVESRFRRSAARCILFSSPSAHRVVIIFRIFINVLFDCCILLWNLDWFLYLGLIFYYSCNFKELL